MEGIYNELDVYYQNKYEFIKNMLGWSFLLTIISIFSIRVDKLNNMILQIICLVIIIILLVFITHSYNINPNETLKITRINIIIILFVYILKLIPLEYFESLKLLFIFKVENNNMEQGSIYFFIGYYILSKNKIESIKRDYFFILTIIISLNIASNFIKGMDNVLIILYILIAQIIMVIAIKNSLKNKLVVNKCINVFNVNIIVCIICVNVRQVAQIFNLNIIHIIVSNINTAIFITALTAIINNITKSMYDFIFKDIHDTNKKLEFLNNEIVLRNEELEKSEREIEHKQNSYRKLLNLLPKAIAIISIENNRIRYCNSDFKKVIGIDDIRKILNKRIENVIKMDFDYKNINYINKGEIYLGSSKLDSETKLEIRLSNYSESKKEITMTFEDITEKLKIEVIKSELERKKINDDIKKNFLSNISHDFKIPVNVISSATQLENLLIENNDSEGVKKYNAISKQNCLTLIKLTNNIIDISKISSEYVNPILTSGNIVEFIEDLVVSLVEYAKLSKISIIFDTYEEELYMKYDKELMERIVLNLVSNAIKFTPEQGYINIKISSVDNNILISIEDTGIGMDEEFTKEIFNKYSMNLESIYANVQGTGVGLYVVYNLIHLQKGKIWVDSKIGKGTKFTMKFCKE